MLNELGVPEKLGELDTLGVLSWLCDDVKLGVDDTLGDELGLGVSVALVVPELLSVEDWLEDCDCERLPVVLPEIVWLVERVLLAL